MELTIKQVDTLITIKEEIGVDITEHQSPDSFIADFMSKMLDDILEDIIEGLVIGLDPMMIQHAKDELLKRSKIQ